MPTPKPTPIDYQGPVPSRQRPPFTLIGLTLYLGFTVVIILMFGWLILPRIETVLNDFSTTLPITATAAMGLLKFLTRGPGVVILIAIPIFIPILIARLTFVEGSPDSTRRRLQFARLGITLVMAILVIGSAAAVLLPVSDLIQNLSSPHK